MNPTLLYNEYQGKQDDELSIVVQNDYTLVQAILQKDPYISQDVNYRLFDTEWIKMYWKNIVADVKGIDVSEVFTTVFIEETVKELATEIVKYYQLPEITTGGAMALAILIFRASKKAGKSGEK